ncbi:hypothetical protein VNN37_02240 [Lactococcus garvieae]|uniref:hypothetical protein n=1 Tax=Lactococcus garvieae TaxID=1363 RepID=UPI0030D2C61A
MNEQLKQFAEEAVKNSACLGVSNEGKKRTAFAYVNEKIIENKLDNISFAAIDEAIEDAYMMEEGWKEY